MLILVLYLSIFFEEVSERMFSKKSGTKYNLQTTLIIKKRLKERMKDRKKDRNLGTTEI